MLYGTVTDPAGLPYEGASVEIKGKDFHTLFHALTDAQGLMTSRRTFAACRCALTEKRSISFR